MKGLEAALLLAILAGGVWALTRLVLQAVRPRQASIPWKCETHTQPDGSVVVEVRRPGEAPRKIGSIPAASAADPLVDQLGVLRLMKEDGELLAEELNRKRGK